MESTTAFLMPIMISFDVLLSLDIEVEKCDG